MNESSPPENTNPKDVNLEFVSWNELLQWPAFVLLVLAAMLKSHQLSTSPYTENLLFHSRPFTAALLAFEIVLAYWLVSRWRPRQARRFAIATFFIFCLFSIEKITSNAKSCGCFGVFEIPPLVTVMLNIGVIILLFFWQANATANHFPTAFATAGILSLVAVLLPVLAFTTSSLSEVGRVVGNANLVVINTSSWKNKQLPIAGFITGARNYLNGDWDMILYHEDCPVCQRLIRESLNGKAENSTVFVEVPPFKSPTRKDRQGLLWRKLSDEHEWFVAAPNVVKISDGVVTDYLGQIE